MLGRERSKGTGAACNSLMFIYFLVSLLLDSKPRFASENSAKSLLGYPRGSLRIGSACSEMPTFRAK